ncbi:MULTISPECIES: IS66 family transposase [unclassified Bradyrhizobium]|uniref:IS66 family transposase n=1 Tax=unclassified Bradyrhizobium TaxID=2631580 RepID=UPI0029162CE9|nr:MULTISPECIES: transposase [unclassified Bradyrhizobium]
MVAKIDALFAVEREINILPAHQRKALRNERSCSLVEELEAFLRERRAVRQERDRQGDRLQPHALGGVHVLRR